MGKEGLVYNKLMPSKTRVLVSGLKPTGELHIGNYLGTIKNLVDLQDKNYKRFYFIADYHALTVQYDPKEKRQQIFNMAVDAMAAGIDPKKSIIFLQSDISAHNNLAWLLGNITSTGELGRMIEYKEKVAQGEVPNAGLFNYPVLMSADILIYDADFVPVGEDQRQHLELTRTLARAFNKRFGKTFKEPKALHTNTPRIMSLNNPDKKMSKSIPSGCLFLSDSPSIIKKKVMSATTDSQKTIGYDPKKRAGVSNLIDIYAAFADISQKEVVKRYKDAGYATFKEELADLIIEKLQPFREKRAKLLKNKAGVMKVLEKGAKEANPIAQKKLEQAHKKAGLL